MCNCVNVEMGSYSNQSTVSTPAGRKVSIDNCILEEIKELWDLDIITIESCCGHNSTRGYIAVSETSVWKMKALGYKNDPAGHEVFYPKSI